MVRTWEIITSADAPAPSAGLDLTWLIDGLVNPIPNRASDQGLAVFDDVPIVSEVAGRVAHRVGILADEHRLVEEVGVTVHPVHARIHLRVKVREAVASIVLAVARALVVDGTRVKLADALVAVLEVATAATLVAHAPKDDRGVVTVAQNHAVDAVDKGRDPRGHTADALVCVILQIRLVHAVKPVVVEHRVHALGVRVVGRADGVDVVLLHQEHVAQHRLRRHGAPVERVSVVTVHPFEEDALPVDVDKRSVNLDVAETILCAECHLVIALFVALDDAHGVEVGCLGGPRQEVVELKGDVDDLDGVFGHIGDDFGQAAHLVALRVEEAGDEHLLPDVAGTVVERKAYVHRTPAVARCRIKAARDVMVTDGGLRSAVDVNVAEDAAHAEHVLAFEVAAVRPAENLHGYTVGACADIVGDVELCHVVRALRADIVAVDVDESGTVNASEVDVGALALAVGGFEVEDADIRAHGVDAVVLAAVVEARACLNVGRGVAVGIFNVAVDGTVVALHLPVGGNGDGVPVGHVVVLLIEIQRTLRWFAHELEAPCPVQALIGRALRLDPRRGVVGRVVSHGLFRGIGHKRGVAGFLVFGKTGLVFPIW